MQNTKWCDMADSGHLSQRNLEVINNEILLNGDNQGEYKCVVISPSFFLAHQIITLHSREENESFWNKQSAAVRSRIV